MYLPQPVLPAGIMCVRVDMCARVCRLVRVPAAKASSGNQTTARYCCSAGWHWPRRLPLGRWTQMKMCMRCCSCQWPLRHGYHHHHHHHCRWQWSTACLLPAHLSHRKNEKTLPPALSLAEAAAGPEAGTVWRPDGLCRQEADRKSLPSQPSPRWRPEVVRSREGAGAGAGLEASAPSPAVMPQCTRSYRTAGGPPGQTPDAPSPSAAQRSQPPARPSPPPGCPSPVGMNRERKKKEQEGKTKDGRGGKKMCRRKRENMC